MASRIPRAARRTMTTALLAAGLAAGVTACGSPAGSGPAGAGSSNSPTSPATASPRTSAAPALPTSTAPGAAAQVPASGAGLDAGAFAAALQIPGTVVVDVRTRGEFEGGHLQGARHIDVSDNFRAGIESLDRSAPYALYCRSGNRSAQAMATMREAGFQRVYHLEGGIGAWQAAGLPVVTR